MSNAPGEKTTGRATREVAASPESEPPSGRRTLVYETSAGGVVLRHIRGVWQVALIEPNIINADTLARRSKARPEGTVFALPKGGIDEGETPEQCAAREVFEETGVQARPLFRLMTIRYDYVRSWGGREQVSKAVSFYVFLYSSGRLGQICPEMRDEVRRAFWFPLDKAHHKLTYRGEREVLKLAQKIVHEHPERLTPPVITRTAAVTPRPQAQQRSGSTRPSGQAVMELFASVGRRPARCETPSTTPPTRKRRRRRRRRPQAGNAAGASPQKAGSASKPSNVARPTTPPSNESRSDRARPPHRNIEK